MKKPIIIAVCVALVCAFLSGCRMHQTNKPVINHDIKETTAADITNTPSIQHVTQELSENLYIDATAVIPGKNQYSTYTLKMVDCDPDRLFNLFCPEGHGSYTKEDRGNCIVYHESTGKRLVVYDKYENVIQYTTYNFNTEERPMQDVEMLMYYHTLVYPQAVPHDLSFIKEDEMEEFGRCVFDQLGVTLEAKMLRCVTLSGHEILDFQEELFGSDSNANFMTPTTLIEATDTCYLQFNFVFDGIPLFGTEEPPISSYESFTPMPATATIMFNANGIQSCTIYCPYIIESASESKPILNLEEAIALLKDKYDLQILYDSLEFTDIWMEYIPVQRNEEWVLMPYWCFRQIDEDAEGNLNYFGSAERFNAITGKDLTYGG